MDTTKIPPLIRSAKLILQEGCMHVDNFTGAIVHDTKVERALLRTGGVVLWEGDEWDEIAGKLDAPIAIKRSHGGRKINPVLLDATTASMIVKVWDAINDANKAKFQSLVERFAVVGTIDKLWKLVR